MEMKNFLRICLVYFFLFCVSLSVFPEGEKELTKEELFQIYSNKLKQLNLSTVNLDYVRLDEFSVVYNTDEYGRKIPILGCKDAKFAMEIDPFTGRILSCTNRFINEKVHDDPNAPLFKGGSKPYRKKEDIIREAETYLKILCDGFPEEAFFNDASYDVGVWPKADYSYEGGWGVDWKRRADGYVYYYDSIGISVHEKYGLWGYNYNFFSLYHPPQKINITKDQAVEIAKKNIDKIMHSPLLGGWYDGYKAGELDSVELMIVNPNYIHIFKKNYVPIPVPDAKLGWVARFICVTNKNRPSTQLLPTEIWIDAETGELLGGG